MSTIKVIEIQQKIAQWVFNHAPKNWGKFCIYIELLPNEFDVNDKFMENAYTIVWFDTNGKKLIDIEIAGIDVVELTNYFMDLNHLMADMTPAVKSVQLNLGDFNYAA